MIEQTISCVPLHSSEHSVTGKQCTSQSCLTNLERYHCAPHHPKPITRNPMTQKRCIQSKATVFVFDFPCDFHSRMTKLTMSSTHQFEFTQLVTSFKTPDAECATFSLNQQKNERLVDAVVFPIDQKPCSGTITVQHLSNGRVLFLHGIDSGYESPSSNVQTRTSARYYPPPISFG